MATADGEDITIGELRAEAAATAARDGPVADTRSGLLRAVLDRRLWAREARRAKRDQDVRFILARRRAEEALLAEMEIGAVRGAVAAPSEEEVDRFLQKHPGAFLRRTVFEIDQVSVRTADDALARRLASARSLDQATAMLGDAGLVGQRSRTEWNSLFMPASLAARLERQSPDGLLVHRDGDRLVVARVLAKTPAPLDYADRKALARQSLMQQKTDTALAARLDQLRASATIRYQPGFAPAAP